MPPTSPKSMDRSTVQRLFLALVGSLVVTVTLFAALFWLGSAPLLRTGTAGAIASVLAAVAGGTTLLGWLWARPLVPLRDQEAPVENFWRDDGMGVRALLLWVLWEGSAMIGAVGTLLTGSLLTAAVGVVAVASLVTHGPGDLENRGLG
jgi:hypothetical protein